MLKIQSSLVACRSSENKRRKEVRKCVIRVVQCRKHIRKGSNKEISIIPSKNTITPAKILSTPTTKKGRRKEWRPPPHLSRKALVGFFGDDATITSSSESSTVVTSTREAAAAFFFASCSSAIFFHGCESSPIFAVKVSRSPPTSWWLPQSLSRSTAG